MATIKDVAREANVSTATVSYVLNNSSKSITPETRKRVINAAKKLNYQTDFTAKALKTGVTRTLGIIIFLNDIEEEHYNFFMDPYVSIIIGGVGAVAQKENYSLMLSMCDFNYDIGSFFNRKKVDGAIILGNHIEDPRVEKAIEEKLPLVLIEHDTAFIGKINSLKLDYKKAMANAVNYLVRLGHKNIGYISGPLNIPSSRERFKGYQQGLRENNIEFSKDNVIYGTWQEESGVEAASAYAHFKEMPTAICCASDRMAIGLSRGLQKLGYVVPDDVSVVGHDNIKISKHVHPSLTTIDAPYYDMAQEATNLLIDLINGEHSQIQCLEFDSQLKIRNSTAAVKDLSSSSS